MELVEGPNLSDRIRQGAAPLDEALHIARQIAEALGAAHEKGIVHWDLTRISHRTCRPSDGKRQITSGIGCRQWPEGGNSL